jgi:hypothetical protein
MSGFINQLIGSRHDTFDGASQNMSDDSSQRNRAPKSDSICIIWARAL